MVTLNDYLYSGDTVFKIIQNYMTDLRKEAKRTHNEIDLVHSNCLLQVQEMLEHNDFLTSQSQKIREFYKYMAKEFPFLAFTFRGRIKSLIRTEEKFNGYIVEYIYNYYEEHGTYPAVADLKEKLSCFRDIIAYRIVIALPKCHLKPGQNLEEEEMKYLYQIANALPGFLEERGFTAEPAKGVRESKSDLLDGEVKPYYRDLYDFVKKEYSTHVVYPPADDIFNALHLTPLSEVKVLILGQDPYHNEHQAHGLSFSVLPDQKEIPPSLQNIYKELQDDLGCYIPDNGYLEKWAKQGVLLLNTVLTVRAHQANSHQGKGWEHFTDAIIQAVNAQDRPVVYMLWGRPAQSKKAMLNNPKHLILKAPHPSPLSAYRGFFGCKHFSQANAFLEEHGVAPIDWQIENL